LRGLTQQKRFGKIASQEREKDMSNPKSATIRKNIAKYAAKVGLRIDRNYDGTYNVFDTVIGYNAFTSVDMAWVVRTIHDAIYMKNFPT
jgi:hypothetical protein